MSFTDKEEFDVDAKDCNLCKIVNPKWRHNLSSIHCLQNTPQSSWAKHTLVAQNKKHIYMYPLHRICKPLKQKQQHNFKSIPLHHIVCKSQWVGKGVFHHLNLFRNQRQRALLFAQHRFTNAKVRSHKYKSFHLGVENILASDDLCFVTLMYSVVNQIFWLAFFAAHFMLQNLKRS